MMISNLLRGGDGQCKKHARRRAQRALNQGYIIGIVFDQQHPDFSAIHGILLPETAPCRGRVGLRIAS
jgi:hypothetical protein